MRAPACELTSEVDATPKGWRVSRKKHQRWDGVRYRPLPGEVSPIDESLPLARLERGHRPRPVVDLAVIPPELELVGVAVQVLLGDVMEGAIDAALEQGEEGLGGVDVGCAPDILLLAVGDCLMPALELLANASVGRQVIRHDGGTPPDMLTDGPVQGLTGQVLGHESPGLPAPLNQGDDRSLSGCASTALAAMGLATHVGLVHFDRAAQLRREGAGVHGVTNPVSHVPSALVGAEAEVALKLQGRDPLLRGAH